MHTSKAIGYARVSTIQQVKDGVSIDAQTSQIESYCTFRKLELERVITDCGVSGGIQMQDRDGGSELLEELRSGEYTDVIIVKLDRAFRNVVDCLKVVQEWQSLGINVHIQDIGGQSVDTSSAYGMFFLTVLAALAEMERKQVSERTKTGLWMKKQKREYCGGGIPYGFKLADDGKVLVPDKHEREIIEYAVELRDDGLSYRGIARALHEEGFRSRTGGKFHAQSVKRMLDPYYESEAAAE